MTAPNGGVGDGPDAYQVVLVSPEGYTHSAALAEMVETVTCGLRALGHEVTQPCHVPVPGAGPAIFFGAHLLSPAQAEAVPENSIIYNLEQVDPSSSWCSPTYLGLLRRLHVWDYSSRNLEALRQLGVTARATHVPVGYVPELTRIPRAATEDIDVLFYGSVNERRARVINDLKEMGLAVEAVFGVYGESRDALIARAKVVLNLHYYDASVFELVRVSYLLANHKAVVAECHPGTEIDPDMEGAVRLATYGQLADACRQLVEDEQARQQLAEDGFAKMAARDEATILARALRSSAAPSAAGPSAAVPSPAVPAMAGPPGQAVGAPAPGRSRRGKRPEGAPVAVAASRRQDKRAAARDRAAGNPKASSCQKAAGGNKVLLSACMIVKDEEKALPDCLKSLQGLVDEVVVYDTGSTDGTIELARRTGARVIEGYWDDDFGRARNASLDHCQGEWILWIDADERFASPDNPILRQALRGLSGDALAVEIYNLGDDPGDSNVNIHRALRIFRRDRCRWYGAIHEQVDLQPGLEDTLMVVPVKGAHIDHIGYRTDVVNERDKLARNLRLAHAARASGNAHRGQEGVADLNVARALAAMGRFPEAQGYFDSALEQVGPGIALRATLLFSAQNLTQCGQFERSIEQALQLREDCEQKGLTYFLEGVALRRMGRTTQAIEALEKVDGLTSEDGFAFPETFLRAELAGALCEADRMGEAADYLALMVAESPDVLTIRTALKVFAATGKSLADLAAAMPENRLEKVAAALILVPPVVADSAAEALYTRFGPRPQLLAAAIRFAPMVATARALDWSARLRSIGLSEPCPLIAQAKIEVLEVPARIRAAVTAHAAFNDERGAKLAMALAVGLKEHELDAVTREISLIDPALAGDFARAVAAVPDLSEAGAAQFTNHNRPVTDTSPPTAQLAAMSTDQ